MNRKKIFILRDVLDILTDNELKNVVGGYVSDDGTNTSLGTCCAKYSDGCICRISRSTAWSYAKCDDRGENCTYNWCCDSCGSTQTGWPENNCD